MRARKLQDQDRLADAALAGQQRDVAACDAIFTAQSRGGTGWPSQAATSITKGRLKPEKDRRRRGLHGGMISTVPWVSKMRFGRIAVVPVHGTSAQSAPTLRGVRIVASRPAAADRSAHTRAATCPLRSRHDRQRSSAPRCQRSARACGSRQPLPRPRPGASPRRAPRARSRALRRRRARA